MDTEKAQTYKYLRDKRPVQAEVKENLQQFNRAKRAILEALGDDELTIAQISEKLGRPRHEILYYLMSLIKFGFIQAGGADDMDEYFTYKRKK